MTVSARETVLAAVGVAGVALAVVAVAGLAPGGLTDAVTVADATVTTAVLGLGLLGYAFARRRRNDSVGDDARLAERERDLEADDSAGEFDRELQLAAYDVDAPVVQDAREGIRERVRATAVRAYARRNGVSHDDARDAVAAGEWTDDVVAAAFAGDERAPPLPLAERLRGWIRPDRAYQRRATRAVDAVHRLATEGSR